MPSNIIQKVRIPKIRPPEASPKERDAWANFLAMAKELQGDGSEMSPVVRSELDRLVRKGNPLAISLQRKIEAAAFKPRGADDEPLPPPTPRRISRLQWGRPKQSNERK